MTTALSKQQTAEFRACVQIVRKGINTFREVGQALTKIRDEQWYKQSHKTFEAFCIAEFGFKRSHAYRLIEAAAAVETSHVGDKLKTERQVREHLDQQKHHPVADDSDDDQADGGAVPVTSGQLAGMELDPVGVSEQGAAAKFRERLIGWTEKQFDNIDDLSWQVAASVFLQLGDDCETWN